MKPKKLLFVFLALLVLNLIQFFYFFSSIQKLKAEIARQEKEIDLSIDMSSAIQSWNKELEASISAIYNKPTPTPQVVYKTKEVQTKVNPSNDEYESWCRGNTLGLSPNKNNEGKLVCAVALVPQVCPVCPYRIDQDNPFDVRY